MFNVTFNTCQLFYSKYAFNDIVMLKKENHGSRKVDSYQPYEKSLYFICCIMNQQRIFNVLLIREITRAVKNVN
jgi:hypothetical protein